MVRKTGLWNEITSLDNLLLAFYKAQKGKAESEAICTYRENLNENLTKLQHQLLTGNFQVGNYHYFKVYDPKERVICAADFSERVLHHAIMNVCHPHFDSFQIYDSYATRLNKGTFKALERAKEFQSHYKWYLKFDIRKYFDTIDHAVLFNLLSRRFKEPMLLALFSQIIDSYHTKQGQGIPIGNLTSQYFANHYLAIMDHFIQTDLHIKPYIRYMDDFVIWHHNKEDLKQLGQQITEFLIEKLGLSLKTYVLNSSPKGIGFLGFRVYPHRIYLARRSKVRFKAKMKRYTTMLGKQIISQEAYSIRVQSLHSFVSHAESLYFRQRVLSQIGQ